MHPSLPAILLLASPFLHVSTASSFRPVERHGKHRGLAARADTAMEARATAQIPLGGFSLVGDSGVSAQMMFLGTHDTVYILDKTENNALTLTTNGVTHPAWGTSYNLKTNVATPLEVASNTFCAGGFSLANGSYVVFGGNQPVTYNGTAVSDKIYNPTGANPYRDADGGSAIRMITPCDDLSCAWQEGTSALTMSSKRWYPTVEALGDGSVIILGGDTNGGYVSTQIQNNPTYEYWPKRASGAINMTFLSTTVPLNLFPLTWLMPSGKLFMQAAYKTILYNMDTKTETPLPDMPHAVRVYPASAAAVMLPLTPANGYKATILFCGGSAASFTTATDVGPGYNITAVPADDSCVRISPDDANPTYTDDDKLPEARSMGQLIYLPDGTMWLGNGVSMGTAGYGDQGYSTGQSYGQFPVYSPAIYNPNAPAGSRFSRTGLSDSLQERMYHSSALLLPDGSILISGSNPNKDFTDTQWGTNYAVERWYPLWFNKVRPVPSGFPSSLSYGGPSWNLTYTAANSTSNAANTKVVVIRTGFSTHCMNFGQRYLELATSFVNNQETGQVTIISSQMPPNSNIFQPGPAMLFLVVDGIPSQGQMVMIGSGVIGAQALSAATSLPPSQVIVGGTSTAVNVTASAAGAASTTQISTVKSAGRSQYSSYINSILASASIAICFAIFAL